MSFRPRGFLLACALLATGAGALPAQVLTLRDALDRAGRDAYANRIASGQRRAAEGQAAGALRGILPTARLEGGYLRTNDPLNAFGFQLRQRSVTQASFDPSLLNYPNTIGNLNTGVVLEVPLLNADAWAGRSAGGKAASAAGASETWTRGRTRLDVIRAYYGAVLAAEQVRTLDTAFHAAEAHVRQAQSAVRNGIATASDAMLAEVKAGEVETQLLRARQDAVLARRQLATLLGAPDDTGLVLPQELPPAADVRALLEAGVSDSLARADVQAATLGREAAEADVRRAKYVYIPRLNAFGRMDWNSPDTPFGGQEMWTAGVMLSWSPFAGGSEIAERRAAEGRAASARAMEEAAAAQARIELARADGDVAVARARLDIAERSVAQGRDAHRIVSRKYEGGLATITEVFDAAAAERMAQLGFASARYEGIAAAASQRQARGLDPAGIGLGD